MGIPNSGPRSPFSLYDGGTGGPAIGPAMAPLKVIFHYFKIFKNMSTCSHIVYTCRCRDLQVFICYIHNNLNPHEYNLIMY